MKDDVQNRLGFIAALPDPGADIPTEFQIFPSGRIEIEGGEPFTVDAASMDAAIREFKSRGLDMVVDYEHQTEKDTEAPAAGWIKELFNKGKDGLWAKVEWTDRARQYLANREYRYYSPVFMVSKSTRKLVELLRVALTNAPRLNWIRPIVAKDESSRQEDRMEFLILCAKKLGLPEASTEEQILAAIEKAKQPVDVVACKEVCDALGLTETAPKSEVVATIHALNALKQKPDLSAEVAALKAKLAGRDRDELVAAALKDGKITPAQKEWAETYALADPEGFRVFVAKAPQVLPTGSVSVPGDPAKPGAIDGTQLEINKLMGIDDETFKKYAPAKA